jgi:hypothetical protein
VPVKAQAVLPEPQQHGHHVAAYGGSTAQQLKQQVEGKPAATSLGVVRLWGVAQ